MLQAGAGGGEVSVPNIRDAETRPRSYSLSREEFEPMNKTIIVSLAILGLSTSAALAAKTHHAKKPDAAPAASTPAPMNLFSVSAADKELYAKNKRESGMK
jgi:hypothetical protein